MRIHHRSTGGMIYPEVIIEIYEMAAWDASSDVGVPDAY
jgi:hypothetical protein